MLKDLKLNQLVQQILLVTRDHILSSSAKCHMLVLATPKFLATNPHLQGSVSEHPVFGPTVVLNITPQAISPITLGDEWISFNARYGGVERQNFVQVGDIVALFSPDPEAVLFDIGAVNVYGLTGEGSLSMIMVRPLNSYEPAATQQQETLAQPAVSKERPALKVVK